MIAVFNKPPMLNSLLVDGVTVVFSPFELAMVDGEEYVVISMVVFPEQEH